jgi:hypothetical protein
MDIPATKAPGNPHQAASQHHFSQLRHNPSGAILDEDTGDLLEYRHLIKHPKYRDIWLKSFGTEIRRLVTATGTGTIVFKPKNKLSVD